MFRGLKGPLNMLGSQECTSAVVGWALAQHRFAILAHCWAKAQPTSVVKLQQLIKFCAIICILVNHLAL
jgi:hypothetical protein